MVYRLGFWAIVCALGAALVTHRNTFAKVSQPVDLVSPAVAKASGMAGHDIVFRLGAFGAKDGYILINMPSGDTLICDPGVIESVVGAPETVADTKGIFVKLSVNADGPYRIILYFPSDAAKDGWKELIQLLPPASPTLPLPRASPPTPPTEKINSKANIA